GMVRQQAGGGAEVLVDVLDLDAVTRVRAFGSAGINRPWAQLARYGDRIELPAYGGAFRRPPWAGRGTTAGMHPVSAAAEAQYAAPAGRLGHGGLFSPDRSRRTAGGDQRGARRNRDRAGHVARRPDRAAGGRRAGRQGGGAAGPRP